MNKIKQQVEGLDVYNQIHLLYWNDASIDVVIIKKKSDWVFEVNYWKDIDEEIKDIISDYVVIGELSQEVYYIEKRLYFLDNWKENVKDLIQVWNTYQIAIKVSEHIGKIDDLEVVDFAIVIGFYETSLWGYIIVAKIGYENSPTNKKDLNQGEIKEIWPNKIETSNVIGKLQN